MILAYLGATGSVIILVGAVWTVVSAMVRQKVALNTNTIAVDHLTEILKSQNDKLAKLITKVAILEERSGGKDNAL